MKSFISGHISRTMYLVILLVFLPAFVIVIRFGLERNEADKLAAKVHMQEIVANVADQQARILGNSQAVLGAVANMPTLRKPNTEPDVTLALFAWILADQSTIFQNLYLLSPTGDILISGAGEAQKLSASASQSFKSMLTFTDFNISSLTIDPVSGKPTIFCFYPVSDFSGIKTILAASLDLEKIQEELGNKEFIANSSFALCDKEGNILFSYPKDYFTTNIFPKRAYDLLRTGDIDQDILQLQRSDLDDIANPVTTLNQSTNKSIQTLEEEKQLFVFQKLRLPNEELYAFITMRLNVEDAYATANRSFLLHIVILCFAMLVGICVTYFIIRINLIHPLQNLVKTARAVGKGNLKVRTNLPGISGEIGVLAHSLDSMAIALEARNTEITEAKKIADKANKAKGEFLANMSHEIRTPMNAIIGLTYLALRGKLDSQQKDYLDKIYVASNTLLGIINDILDFSKIEAYKLDLEAVPFSLEETFQAVNTLVAQKADEKRLEILFAIAPNIPANLIGDPLRINHILTNIISNAVKFTEHGEIVINCSLHQSEIIDEHLVDEGLVGEKLVSEECKEDLHTDNDEKAIELLFSIRDTGIGMSQEQITHLFQPFTQADTSTTRQFGGTGLGLTITKRLIELMGGRIWINSLAGKGTTVSFIIKLKYTSSATLLSTNPASLKGIPVLIVDDNESARIILSKILTSLTLVPKAVASAQEAYAELMRTDETAPYKIIFLDWRMPEISGIEAANHIHSMNLRHTPPIVLITAFAKSDLQDQAKAAQIHTILHKPINPSKIFNTALDILQMNRQTAATQYQLCEPTEPLQTMRGLKILLVEDNTVNQQVALEILNSEGVKVTIASNGQQAVDILTSNPDYYHMVLMDLQMPVMDGYAATKALREFPQFQEIPIIAMTAHAMNNEKKLCLRAGMDDHISKPIEVDKLFSVISSWIPKTAFYEEQKTHYTTTDITALIANTNTVGAYEGITFPPNDNFFFAPPHGEAAQHILHTDTLLQQTDFTTPDKKNTNLHPQVPFIPGIDTALSLKRLGGNNDLYMKTLHMFHARMDEYALSAKTAIDTNNTEQMALIAHTIKGLAATIGATALETISTTLERNLKSNTNTQAHFVAFFTQFETLKARLDEHLQSEAQKNNCADDALCTLSSEECVVCTQKLQDYLNESDAEATNFFTTNKATFLKILGPEKTKQIEKHLQNFEFEAVCTIIGK